MKNHFSRIRAELEGKALDALLITSGANVFYTSAFHTTGEGDALSVVTKDGAYFITDGRYTEAAQASVRDAELIIRENAASYVPYLKKILSDGQVKRLGFEDAALTVKQYREFSEALPCEFVPASDVLVKLRASKDTDEVKCMRDAQRIADRALTQLLEELRLGMTEKEIAARSEEHI